MPFIVHLIESFRPSELFTKQMFKDISTHTYMYAYIHTRGTMAVPPTFPRRSYAWGLLG